MIHEGTIQLEFRYAAGGTASRFLVALRDDAQILAARCPSCERALCPAPAHCARCGDATGELVPVGPGGVVETWTATGAGDCFGLVKLDGADTAMLHHLLGDASSWRVGARVRARFAAKRTASILDIEGFEVGEGGA